jgi:Major Facilitator Superfamily
LPPAGRLRKLAAQLGSFCGWAVFAHLPRNAAFTLWTRLGHLWITQRAPERRQLNDHPGRQLQSVLGYSALEAGLQTLPVSIGLLIGAGSSTRLVPRRGTKLVVASGLVVLAGGLAIFGTLEAHSGYSTVAIAFVVLGFGMGLAMAPATDSIMGSLPLAQASVGSAINDTLRMVGGALGVAVLGSILSSRYSSDMASAVQGLPAPAARAARDSLGAALHVAAQSGSPALAGAAKNAFVGGMTGAIWIAAAIAVAGAIVALIALPPHERAELSMAAGGGVSEAVAA